MIQTYSRWFFERGLDTETRIWAKLHGPRFPSCRCRLRQQHRLRRLHVSLRPVRPAVAHAEAYSLRSWIPHKRKLRSRSGNADGGHHVRFSLNPLPHFLSSPYLFQKRVPASEFAIRAKRIEMDLNRDRRWRFRQYLPLFLSSISLTLSPTLFFTFQQPSKACLLLLTLLVVSLPSPAAREGFLATFRIAASLVYVYRRQRSPASHF